jgi:hypothetical protein
MKPGTRVRYSGKFMRSCGITNGTRKWTVQACACGLCADGRFVALDEQDIDSDSMPALRHIAVTTLEVTK